MAIESLKSKIKRAVTASKREVRHANSRIRERQAEADALFLSIGDGAIVIDANGRVSRINQTALQILGFREKDLVGMWYPGTVIAEDMYGRIIPNMRRPISQVFLSGETVTARIYYRRKDGSTVPVSLNVAPVMVRGKPIGAIEVFRDITDELEMERARDDFISIASHQLRTPATSVKQYSAMLLEGYAEELTPQQRQLLDRAYQSNERQLAIIEDLLNVARIDAGNIKLNLRKTNIIKLIKDVITDQASKSSARKQELSFSYPRKELYARVDSERFRMVLENILDNAIKYTPQGKSIEIEARQEKKQVVIRIIDRGVGIPAKDLDKLFQKFERIPNRLSVEAGGTGLGLYWVEKIVKLHDGWVGVSSKPGRGSTFTVYLPLYSVKKAAAPKK